MSVENTKVVDLVGIDKQSGHVVLTLSDHLPWESHEHLLILQDKLNTYLSFIESGELMTRYPDAQGRKPQITIVLKYPPNKTGVEFLNRVAEVVETAGIEFRHEIMAGKMGG
jgi:hypothetical protein